MSVLIDFVGYRSIIDFLDEFEPVCNKYMYHRYILERTRESNLQFERSARPGMLKLDVDWAENYTMLNAREIQSEYWLMHQASIFVCIGKMLLASAWQAKSGELKPGAEVTVEPEGAEPYWAKVVSAGALETADCTVTDEAGATHIVQWSLLRARVWHTTAQIGVTNDRKHDSYSTQHFMTAMIQQWLTFHEPVVSLHVHSDNAGSHFKNSRTLNYLSRLKGLFQQLQKVTWSFGCPGHGKGPWDGVGGLMKRVLRSDTINQKVTLLCCTVPCCIVLLCADCAQDLQAGGGSSTAAVLHRRLARET